MTRLQENGALREDALYIERSADQELYQALISGEVCAILAPRQIGKSSLRVRTSRMLAKRGMHCAQVDLTALGKTADQNPISAWYFSLVARIARELKLPDPKSYYESSKNLLPVDRFGVYLREQVLTLLDGPVVLFIDEIDYLRSLAVDRDEFFVAIRALYDERAYNPALKRLTFCLLGVAAPRDLVKNPDITPFNIGRAISLRDFNRTEMDAFIAALRPLGGNPSSWVDAVYRWTAGHPYMTQALCHQLILQVQKKDVRVSEHSLAEYVESVVQARFLRVGRSYDDNLSYSERRLELAEQRPELLSLYRKILAEGSLPLADSDPLVQDLQLCGMVAPVVTADGQRNLRVRNLIFERVFNSSWVREQESHRKLLQATRRWQERGQDDYDLLRGQELAEAERWASLHPREITVEENSFLRACLDLARRDAERERLASEARIQRRTVWGLATAAALLLLLTAGLYRQYIRAQESARREQRAAQEARKQQSLVEEALREVRAQRDRAEDMTQRATNEKDRAEASAHSERAAKIAAQKARAAEEMARSRAEKAAIQAQQATDAERAAKQEALWERANAELAAKLSQSAAEDAQNARAIASNASKNAQQAARIEKSLRAALLALQPVHQIQALVASMQAVLLTPKDQLGPAWEGLNRTLEALTIPTIIEGHTGSVRSVAFSPDGGSLATASEDSTVRIWNLWTHKTTIKLIGHSGLVRSIAYSADGQWLVSASDDRTAIIWNARTGNPKPLKLKHRDKVLFACFSPDGRRVVTTSGDRTVSVWETDQGRLETTFTGHTDWVWSAAFSPDGLRIATASADKTVRIWSTSSGRHIRTLQGHTDRLRSVVYSADGRRIVTASMDGTARVWDAATGASIMILDGHVGGVWSVAFAPDNTKIVTGGEDRVARIWCARTGHLLNTLVGHSKEIWGVSFAADSARISTAGEDKTARVWNLRANRMLTFLRGHTGPVESAEYSPDGYSILTAGSDGTTRVWDALSGLQLFALSENRDAVKMASYSSSGARIATAGADGIARIWDVSTRKLWQETENHGNWVRSARFSPLGDILVTGGDDRRTRIWDVRSSRLLDSARTKDAVARFESRVRSLRQLQDLAGEQGLSEGGINSIAFSQDSTKLITGSTDRVARIWDLDSRKLTKAFSHPGAVWSAVLSRDEKYILIAGEDRSAQIWDVTTGNLHMRLSGHADSIWSATYSPDGRMIATASEDRTVRIWDAYTGQILVVLEGHSGPVRTVAFSPDGSSVVTAGQDEVAVVHSIEPANWFSLGCRYLQTLRNHPDAPEMALKEIFEKCKTSANPIQHGMQRTIN